VEKAQTQPRADSERSRLRNYRPALLVALLLPLYLAGGYGGIRSPDAELLFRTARSLSRLEVPAVAEPLSGWPEFGLAPGVDGRYYAIFGPLQPLLAAGLVGLNHLLVELAGCRPQPWLGPSHYLPGGMAAFLKGEAAAPCRPHAERFAATWFNALVTALASLLVLLLGRQLGLVPPAAWLAGLLFGLATPAWAYAGTFFAEPLADLGLLLCLWLLLREAARARRQGRVRPLPALLAGAALGLAGTAHLSAWLQVPFLAGLAVVELRPLGRRAWPGLGLAAAAALLVVLVLGLYNWARFGDWLETGRSAAGGLYLANPYSGPGNFWRGLWGLLGGAGKGLLWYCPLAVAGLACWPRLLRRSRSLGWWLLAAMLFRLLLLAGRYEWHGGFCLGPRHLYPLFAMLALACGCWLSDQLQAGSLRRLRLAAAAGLLLAAQQLYFALGEVFSLLHALRAGQAARGIDVFAGDHLYLDWQYSPLWRLAGWRPAPFWLHGGDWPVLFHLAWLLPLLALLWTLCWWPLLRRARPGKEPA